MIARSISRPRLCAAAPRLPEIAPLIVFDDLCVLCSGFVQWVIKRDRHQQFWFTSAQGEIGQALYVELGLDPVEFETNLLIIDGLAYGKMDAFVEVAVRVGGVWTAAAMLRGLPRGVRDWLYDRIARNRYRWFGKRDTCWMPQPELMVRVV